MWLKIKNYVISLDDILFLQYFEEEKKVMVRWKHAIYPLEIYEISEQEFNCIIPCKKGSE